MFSTFFVCLHALLPTFNCFWAPTCIPECQHVFSSLTAHFQLVFNYFQLFLAAFFYIFYPFSFILYWFYPFLIVFICFWLLLPKFECYCLFCSLSHFSPQMTLFQSDNHDNSPNNNKHGQQQPGSWTKDPSLIFVYSSLNHCCHDQRPKLNSQPLPSLEGCRHGSFHSMNGHRDTRGRPKKWEVHMVRHETKPRWKS